jgi:hypothetical protein
MCFEHDGVHTFQFPNSANGIKGLSHTLYFAFTYFLLNMNEPFEAEACLNVI